MPHMGQKSEVIDNKIFWKRKSLSTIHVVKWDVIHEKNIIVIDAYVKVENVIGARLVNYIISINVQTLSRYVLHIICYILYLNLLY